MDVSAFVSWLLGLVKALLAALFDLILDGLTFFLDVVLSAIVGLLSLLPSPSFLSESNTLGNLLSGLPPFALYVIGQLHVPEAFAVVGAGVVFNLARKAITLGQW